MRFESGLDLRPIEVVREKGEVMKYCLMIFAILIPLECYSVPPLDLYGTNKSGEFITVIGESEGAMYSEISIEKNGKRVYLKNQDCKFSDDLFLCSKDGQSPLAGVKYRYKYAPSMGYFYTIDCGEVLSCVDGCNPNAPIELMEAGYECYDEATCPNVDQVNGRIKLKSHKGEISAQSVNVRLNPHSQSKIVATLDRGVRVKVTGTNGVCTKVNGKIGMWVYATIEAGAPPMKGWIYDYYIRYRN